MRRKLKNISIIGQISFPAPFFAQKEGQHLSVQIPAPKKGEANRLRPGVPLLMLNNVIAVSLDDLSSPRELLNRERLLRPHADHIHHRESIFRSFRNITGGLNCHDIGIFPKKAKNTVDPNRRGG